VGCPKLVYGESLIPDVIGTLHLAGRFAARLNTREQQRHQNSDDRDHHKQFNERESVGSPEARLLPRQSMHRHRIPACDVTLCESIKTPGQVKRAWEFVN
jgi:hypothetical protein